MAGTDDIGRGGSIGKRLKGDTRRSKATPAFGKATPRARQGDGFSSKATLRGRKVTDFALLPLNRVNSVNIPGYRAVRVG